VLVGGAETVDWNDVVNKVKASATVDGLMSKENFSKLQNIANNANDFGVGQPTWDPDTKLLSLLFSRNGSFQYVDIDMAHSHPASEVVEDPTKRFVTDDQITTWDAKQNAIPYTPEDASKKDVPNGYAGLNGSGKVPATNLDLPSNLETTTGSQAKATQAVADAKVYTDQVASAALQRVEQVDAAATTKANTAEQNAKDYADLNKVAKSDPGPLDFAGKDVTRPTINRYNEKTFVGNLTGGIFTINPSTTSNVYRLTATSNTEFNITAPLDNTTYSVTLIITQSETTPVTITWPADIKWADKEVPAVTRGGATYVVTFLISGALKLGWLSGEFM